MNYCTKGQWVVIPSTGQIGIVDTIISRRIHYKDGIVIVQCGAGGPFVKAPMSALVEATQKDIDIAKGVRHHAD